MGLLRNYAEFLRGGGLIPYALRGLDYLRRAALGSPPATTGTAAPYTPPFTGGQCLVPYRGILDVRVASNPSQRLIYNWASGGGGTFIAVGANPASGTWSAFTVNGKITGATFDNNGVDYRFFVNGVYVAKRSMGAGIVTSVNIAGLVTASGAADSCGDLPNPNTAPPIASDGLATSPPLNFAGAAVTGIVTGTARAADGSAGFISGGKTDFTDAGVLAPTNIGGALAKIASGLFKVLEVLAILNDILELLKKLVNTGNKSSFSYNFGNLRYDGFIRLQSEPPTASVEALYLDLQVTDVKTGASRIFGEKSPNYYNREPVGYISFVSATFGVLSTHEIRHVRTSIPIPDLAYGFFYNLGLDGVNRANATGFYLRQIE